MANLLAYVPDVIVFLSLVFIAVGRVGSLRINRAGIALTGAALVSAWLVATQGRGALDRLIGYIDAPTIILLTCMMMLTTNLRLSGFFGLASGWLGRFARRPRILLALILLVAGLFSAFFINDTAVIMLTPLVAALCLQAGVNPVPQLIGLAIGANAGSAATLIGNPQNIVIASLSGLDFGRFSLVMLPPVLASLVLSWGLVVLVFRVPARQEPVIGLAGGARDAGSPGPGRPAVLRPRVYRPLLVKSLVASGLFLVALVCGVPAALAAVCATALLLLTRRLAPERVFSGVDWTLPVFFAGLFVISGAARETRIFSLLYEAIGPRINQGPFQLAGVATLLSQLISNVPAVLLLGPVVAGNPQPDQAWMILAASSTLAGNLTLLGSVANLIVAESAAAQGIRLGFLDFLKAGLPAGLLGIALSTAWLGWVVQ